MQWEDYQIWNSICFASSNIPYSPYFWLFISFCCVWRTKWDYYVGCRFQAFTVIWILYMFFWAFPRRQYVICRRFGTMYQFHLQRLEIDPKEHIQYSNQGESLKSTTNVSYHISRNGCPLQILFSRRFTAPSGATASSLLRLYDHTQAHHTPYDSSGWGIRSTQGCLPNNTKHSKETDRHSPGEIRTLTSTKWAVRNHGLDLAANGVGRP